MTDDGESPLDRTRRAKATQKAVRDERRFDIGAVAAGMLATLLPQVAPAILLDTNLPSEVVVATSALTALGVPLGGYVAGWLSGPEQRRGATHGTVAVFASLLAIGAVGYYVTGGNLSAVFGTDVSLTLVVLPALAIGALVGGVAGFVGSGRRARTEREA